MARRRFKQVDVFTRRPFFGNPVGVVLDGAGLDTEAMQRMAAWANISETTFVLPPTTGDADYRVRIFAPRRELPFAGHPTIGTAHAVLEAGIARARDGRLRQECGAGVLALTVAGEGADRQLAVEVPPAKVAAVDPEAMARIQVALGLSRPPERAPQVVDLGPRWLMLELADAAAVRALAPDQTALAAASRALGITGVTAFGRARAADHALAVRSFAPAEAIPEDPVCGSGNAAIGVLLDAAGALPGAGREFVASQGRELGRDGFVTVRVDPATRRTWIGGHSVTCIDGTVPE
jgi:PhzF family phenazine biosynthesis protein